MKSPPYGYPSEGGQSDQADGAIPLRRKVSGRSYHAATRLKDGKVLVTGGCLETYLDFSCTKGTKGADLYDPKKESWSKAAELTTARAGHTSTLLPGGNVLLVGGDVSPEPSNPAAYTSEIYDPVRGSWKRTETLGEREFQALGVATRSILLSSHSSTLIGGANARCGKNCNKVLLVTTHSAWLFDPVLEKWEPAGRNSARCAHGVGCTAQRGRHTASVLNNGQVLVLGAVESDAAEVYDPAADAWQPVAKAPLVTGYGTATALRDGRVLVAGGFKGGSVTQVTSSTTLFEPDRPGADKVGPEGHWQAGNPMKVSRFAHASVRLSDGRVLVVGGLGGAISDGHDAPDAISSRLAPLRSVELFDSKSGVWRVAAPMEFARGGALAQTSSSNLASAAPFAFTATVLQDDRVLVLGASERGYGEMYITPRRSPAGAS